AFATFKACTDRPTLIIVDSHIAWGSPHKHDSAAAHGEPLGEDEIRLTKEAYGWAPDAKFLVPDAVPDHFRRGLGARGRQLREAWFTMLARYRREHPALADELDRIQRREQPEGWDRELPTFEPDAKGLGGRDASAKVLNAVARAVPWLVGGSADLAPSTKTRLTFDGAGDLGPTTPGARNMHFGIRGHAMAAVRSGIALAKLRPFASTFFTFSDYLRPAIRLAAIIELPVIHVYTHDSIGVGEDGPPHQPVEHLASLRAIPGLLTFRPGDANEVVEAYRYVMQPPHNPAAIVLSRQPLRTLDRSRYASASGVAYG